MKSRYWALGVLTAALVGAAPALAAPATVNVRVEGPVGTIWDAPVTTNGHAIEKDHFGPQPCDGTNNGATFKGHRHRGEELLMRMVVVTGKSAGVCR